MPLLDSDGLTRRIIAMAERILYLSVTAILVIMTGVVIYQSARQVSQLNLSSIATSGLAGLLNDVLFAIIILELLSTVIAHLCKGGFQVKSFLYIGIISSVRRILVLGAQLSSNTGLDSLAFKRGITELAVDAGVVVALAVALYVTKVASTPRRQSAAERAEA